MGEGEGALTGVALTGDDDIDESGQPDGVGDRGDDYGDTGFARSVRKIRIRIVAAQDGWQVRGHPPQGGDCLQGITLIHEAKDNVDAAQVARAFGDIANADRINAGLGQRTRQPISPRFWSKQKGVRCRGALLHG